MSTTTRRSPTVVAAVDSSAQSTEALRWAAREAVARDVGLLVVSVARVPVPAAGTGLGTDGPFEELKSRSRAIVTAAMTTAREVAPGVRVEGLLAVGTPSNVLHQLSEENDLLVCGSRGHGALTGLVLGSVSTSVAAHARCPVVVVRPARSGSSEDAVTAFTVATHDRVVVGVDGSEAATRAVMFAAAHARRIGRGLTLLHARGDQARPGARAVPAEGVLTPVATMLRSAGLGLDVDTLEVEGPAAASMVEASHQAALVVVGTRGRGPFVSRLLGSVSLTLLSSATGPVAVVH
ncbi:universal stress protein [Kineococcus gynurae]|uniref:Universal stress protein n=1 Tax=Kineococcus gynurae TaxID=452979 RepID=A0ABV5LSU5_9ACTN